ncbi:MAG: 50S ribosomal protein L15 [Phycisphaerae bacterium]|nr:50S ribosomal protein L15 [Phycisphaerae bacterium]
MMLHDITAAVGASKKHRRRGRGTGSGRGKTSGRGHKGQLARAGSRQHALKEGGSIPMYRRLPIRGFSNFGFTTEYQVVNVADLERHCEDGAEVTVAALAQVGLVRSAQAKLKVLGDGKLSKKLTVTADRLSASAKQKIVDAGGTVTELSPAPKPRVKVQPPAPAAPAEPAKGKKEKGKDRGGESAEGEKPKKQPKPKKKDEGETETAN